MASSSARGAAACTLCPQLRVEGRRPACVNNCLTNALHFGDLEDMEKKAKAMVGDRHATSHEKEDVFYISRKPMDKKLITG